MSTKVKMSIASLVSAKSQQQLDNFDIQYICDLVDQVINEAKGPQGNYIPWQSLSELLKEMALGNKKIECIKLYRQLTGLPLKEAKDEVEKYISNPKPAN